MAILSIGELLGMGPSELSGLIPYSGLEYSGTAITGISGSAIGGAGGVPESSVSAIASSYAESAASSKVDQSAFDDCCSAVNEALSGISGAVSGVTGQTGNYIDWSSSGVFQPSGDYAYNSSLSAYQEISGMTAYQGAGDYAYNSALSSKMDKSESSSFYPMTGNPSGFLTEIPTAYVMVSAVSSWSSDIATLSATVTSLQQALLDTYMLSAGEGISITNDTGNKVTIIGMA